MNTAATEEQEFRDRLEREASELTGLEALRDWYLQRHRGIWEPFHRRMQQLQQDPGIDTTSPELRDRIARELGVEKHSRLLLRLYQRAVEEYIGRAAEALVQPDSDAHREVVEKFDAAWRELANK